MYCFNELGAKIWSANITNTWTNHGITIGSDGTLYFGAADGWLYAINPDSSLKWKYQIGSWINGVPALDSQGNIYIGSTTQSVYALRPNGTLIWSFLTDNFVDASPSIDESRNTIYVGSVGGTLYALDRLTGTKRWEYKAGGALYRAAAIGTDGRIYFGSTNNNFYALLPSGLKVWSVLLDGQIHGLPSIDAANNIYVGTEGGTVFAIKADGTIRWQQTLGGYVNFGAAIGDKVVYVGSSQGLSAIEEQTSVTPTATATLSPTLIPSKTPIPITITATPITPLPTTPVANSCGLSIESGKAFINKRNVVLRTNLPDAQEIQISNDGGFANAQWQTYSTSLPWILSNPGQRIATLLVYVRFRSAGVLLCNGSTVIDDIVYDPLPPKVFATVKQASTHFADSGSQSSILSITATDQPGGSDVESMQISDNPEFTGATWEPFVTQKSVSAPVNNGRLYVRVRDGAENVSDGVAVSSGQSASVYLPIVTR
ncbi:MAG: PQQ-like beta-propeller repeat protein [Anaerolineae bacterium]|nr:PQQ-like beta-propeller repeat protein [Anaerolineae bacterium]